MASNIEDMEKCLEKGIMNMEQGSISLVQKDLDAKIWEAIDWTELCAAYGVRRNIIAFKKVARHALERLETIADDLSLACLYYYHDIKVDDDQNSFTHGYKYKQVSSAFATVRGATIMLQDIRTLTKALACIPRLPNEKGLPRELQKLHFKSAAILLDHDNDFLKHSPTSVQNTHSVKECMLSQISQELRPQVEASLILRGGIKALRIHQETQRLALALDRLIAALNKAQSSQQPENSPLTAASVHKEKRRRQCSAAAAVAKDANNALLAILAAKDTLIFAAADQPVGTTLLIPPEFKGLRCDPELEKAAAIALSFKQEELSAFLRNKTLSQDVSSSPMRAVLSRKGRLQCTRCNENFARNWLTRASQRKICIFCDQKDRDAGICSNKRKCPPAAWCKHARRCLACENYSCDECGIVCGDSQDLLALLEDLTAPVAIFLDFDRTLASTRSGQSPRTARGKKHTVDPLLATLARNHPNVRVVTRNRHREDILNFLAENNSPVRDVHVTEKGQSKSVFVLDHSLHTSPNLEFAGQLVDIIYADDDIRELLDPQFDKFDRSILRLHRLLFTRAIRTTAASSRFSN